MDSRERVFAALAHKEPDRVPVDYWAVKAIDAKLMKRLGLRDRDALLDALDVDLRYIEGPRYVGPELGTHPDGSSDDLWGVPRKMVAVGAGENQSTYEEVVRHPLAGCRSPDDVNAYDRWPSPDWYDCSAVAEQCAKYRRQGKAVVFMGDRLNRIAQWKPMQYLRGMALCLEDMVERPDVFRAIADKLVGFYVEYTRRILEAAKGGIDIVFMGDDFGMQDRMLCSPGMWREFLAPGLKKFIETAKAHRAYVAQHTDGVVIPILGDMIGMGLDIVNPVQPEVKGMDMARLKREFGARITFHGSISIQRTLPFGAREQIREEVRERVRVLGPGGGLILCSAHNIQADTPVENALALFEAYREFGRHG